MPRTRNAERRLRTGSSQPSVGGWLWPSAITGQRQTGTADTVALRAAAAHIGVDFGLQYLEAEHCLASCTVQSVQQGSRRTVIRERAAMAQQPVHGIVHRQQRQHDEHAQAGGEHGSKQNGHAFPLARVACYAAMQAPCSTIAASGDELRAILALHVAPRAHMAAAVPARNHLFPMRNRMRR